MGFEESVEGFADLVFGETELDGAVDGRGGQGAEFLLAVSQRADGAWFEDTHALAADALDDAVEFEPGIGLADGHRVDLGGAGDFANAGEHVAGGESAAGDEGVDLIDELPINRNAGGGVELEEFGASGHVYLCSDTLGLCQGLGSGVGVRGSGGLYLSAHRWRDIIWLGKLIKRGLK